jgi:hypothetical protein
MEKGKGMKKIRLLLPVVLSSLVMALILGITGIYRPAQAGGGGIVDPANPCAFAGYFGTFSDTEASLIAYFANYGQTFTGVGSSITAPHYPSVVSGHPIFDHMDVIQDLGNGSYRYNIIHLVGGCFDPRINYGHGDSFAIVSPKLDEQGRPALDVYCLDELGNGTLKRTITQDDIDEVAEHPVRNTKIASISGCLVPVSFYRLSTGEFQFNIGPEISGHVTEIIFSSLPPRGVYFRDWNIYHPGY